MFNNVIFENVTETKCHFLNYDDYDLFLLVIMFSYHISGYSIVINCCVFLHEKSTKLPRVVPVHLV